MMRKIFGLAMAFVLTASVSASAVTLSTVTLVSNLNRPTWVGSTPALPNLLFVLEKRGVIKSVDMANANAVATYMDIQSVVHAPTSGSDEQGLLGLAFHPNFSSNRFFYVYYTNAAGTFNVISRYTANVGLLSGDSTSASIILSLPNYETNHNGGNLQFGADGKLYAGVGDGGGANDQHGTIGNAQLLTSGDNSHYLGKILRLDVDIPSPYVPSDNPSVGGSPVDLKWLYGLRNPFRWSFDRGTGDLYIGDVGQNAREEIDYIPVGTGGGQNFGWRCMEGNNVTPSCGNCASSGPNCTGSLNCATSPNLTCPIFFYSGTPLCVIGGYVYRGLNIPGEQGNYFYADYILGQISSFKVVGGAATGNAVRLSQSTVTSFGEDAAGQLYYVAGTATATSLLKRIIPSCNNKADINSDCAKDQNDIDILANVLLGIPVGDPALVFRSDMNGDGIVDGTDIQLWINQPFP